MKFWLCVSAAAALLWMTPNLTSNDAGAAAKQRNETTLAGLRPGRDKLRTATNVHGPYYRQVVPGSNDVLAWVDKAKHRSLRVELDKESVIQSITVSTIDPLIDQPSDPKKEPDVPLPSVKLTTGKGIRIAYNVCSEVEYTYGDATSSGPSTQHGNELTLLYYSFDWAGSKVPQVMEVSCARTTGRVVQITLAFPSL
ncbi:MAG: hypothetical protein M1453_04835 [Acidobacteria bacterium]|nr:hypothetical protein [Acidobacteriota bacterium]MCL5287307.1 hypothetical protein [Acidobacteriota bacterium]